MLRYLLLLAFAVSLAGCGEYNKILKKGTAQEKFDAAVRYYNEDECYKSLPLLEELIGIWRGTTKAEQVYYYYAQTHYCIGDYYLANFYFKNFTKSYPTSEFAEECLFLAAMCSYRLSPPYSLDQEQTEVAIGEFQVFIDRYPETELKDSCNTMMTRLGDKLDRKTFEVARLYVQTERFRSARIALQELLDRNPATPYREEVMLLLIESNFRYAELSVDSKKRERYKESVDSYFNFVTYFPESKKIREAESYYNRSQAALEALN